MDNPLHAPRGGAGGRGASVRKDEHGNWVSTQAAAPAPRAACGRSTTFSGRVAQGAMRSSSRMRARVVQGAHAARRYVRPPKKRPALPMSSREQSDNAAMSEGSEGGVDTDTRMEAAKRRLNPALLVFHDRVFERVYQRWLARRNLPQVRRIFVLMAMFAFVFLLQTQRKPVQAGEDLRWEIEWVIKACFYPTVIMMLFCGCGAVFFKHGYFRRAAVAHYQVAVCALGTCIPMMHSLRTVLDPNQPANYYFAISFIYPLYIAVSATTLGMIFPAFLVSSVSITVSHALGFYVFRDRYLNWSGHSKAFLARFHDDIQGDNGRVVTIVGTWLGFYYLATLMFFCRVQRTADVASRQAFLQEQRLKEVDMEVQIEFDTLFQHSIGWLQRPGPRSIIAGLGNRAHNWVIHMEELELETKIGSGGSGQIWRGSFGQTPVALKELYCQCMDPSDVDEFKNECTIMAQLHHPQVLQFFGIAMQDDRLYLVSELMTGSLKMVLDDMESGARESMGGLMTAEQYKDVACGVASGLKFMHSKGFCHRDVKPENVLVDDQLRVKLADFGLSSPLPVAKEVVKAGVGTPHYMPPEFCRADEESYDGKAHDVYAFGMLLWTCFRGQTLYPRLRPYQILHFVGQEGMRPEVDQTWPRRLVLLMRQCWHERADKRPDFTWIERSLGEPSLLAALKPTPLRSFRVSTVQGVGEAGGAGGGMARRHSSSAVLPSALALQGLEQIESMAIETMSHSEMRRQRAPTCFDGGTDSSSGAGALVPIVRRSAVDGVEVGAAASGGGGPPSEQL